MFLTLFRLFVVTICAASLGVTNDPCLAQAAHIHETPAGTSHEMVSVPAGEFYMGVRDHPGAILQGHEVYLTTYLIDRFEVTVTKFIAFLNASDASVPDEYGDARENITGAGPFIPTFPDSTDHPIREISWFGAHAYCSWAGLRLPSEAEWEKAARGADERDYPWGDDEPDRSTTNYGPDPGGSPDDSDGYLETAPVGSFSRDVSPYGVLDLGGNVREWVSDWFSDQYYPTSPYVNPTGPELGTAKVTKGGSFVSYSAATVVWEHANATTPVTASWAVGFRCAKSISDTALPSTTWGEAKRQSSGMR